MRKKIKISVMIFACLFFLAAAGYAFIGNPFVLRNNQKLEHSITSIDSETVALNDVVPFAWDTLYTFPPYQSKAEIEKTIGFHSPDIKENNINEGMVHLLFVQDEKVVASILGYESNLGYCIDFSAKAEGKVTFAENAQFHVIKADGTTKLVYIE